MASGYLRWAGYALLILALVPVGLTIPDLRKARRAPYYVMRQSALKRATRLLLAALVMVVLAGILLILHSRLVVVLSSVPTATAVATPIPTSLPTPTATFTPRPTFTPTTTPTPRPTATAPFIPTDTPEIRPPASALTPLPSAAPAGDDARVQLMALALEADEQGQPVNPGREFPPGRHRVHLFFQYEGMKNGVATTFAWYKDGEFITFCSDTWAWGLVEAREWGEHGSTWYACDPIAGWESGRYEIRVFIETRLQGIAQFVITEQ